MVPAGPDRCEASGGPCSVRPRRRSGRRPPASRCSAICQVRSPSCARHQARAVRARVRAPAWRACLRTLVSEEKETQSAPDHAGLNLSEPHDSRIGRLAGDSRLYSSRYPSDSRRLAPLGRRGRLRAQRYGEPRRSLVGGPFAWFLRARSRRRSADFQIVLTELSAFKGTIRTQP